VALISSVKDFLIRFQAGWSKQCAERRAAILFALTLSDFCKSTEERVESKERKQESSGAQVYVSGLLRKGTSLCGLGREQYKQLK
jgi:hypothetical protein